MTNLRTTVLAVAFATLVAVLVACGDQAGTAGGQSTRTDPGGPTAGTTYVVTSVTVGGTPRRLVAGSEIRIGLDAGRLTISAGCNTMSGAYRLDGTRLSVHGLASTEMGCEAPLMDQDSWVAELFTRPVQLSTGADAAIISGDTVLALADRRTVSPDKPLVGTKWLLDTLYDADTASSVPRGVVAYLQVEGGTVSVYDACNGGSGPVEVRGDTIVFGDRLQTMRGCLRDDGGVEKAFGEVLAGSTTYTVTEGSLKITHGDSGLGFRAVATFPEHD